jgi:hypothetical protein
VNFFKSTFFKTKIEKRGKEEYKVEVDTWLENISSRGVNFENFHKKKPSIVEEETLLHGIEKNIDLENLSKFRRKIYILRNEIFEIYYNNKKDFFIFTFLIILLILMLSIYKRLSKIEHLLLYSNTCNKLNI